MSISTTIIRKGRVFVKTDGGEPVALGQDAAGTGSVKASRLPDLYNQTEVATRATTISDAEIAALGLGTASKSSVSDFATATQGTLADSALQAADNLSDLASASTARTNLGLGTAAVAATTDFAQVANDLSDLASASTARTNLGLGTAAVAATSDFATAAQGTLADSALQAADNLSDLASASTARTNLGLGTIATQAASSVALTGGTISGTTMTLPSYDVAGAPAAGTAGRMIYVTDGNSGAACMAVSDGSNWKIVALGGTITT
jgi:hypothetical protein